MPDYAPKPSCKEVVDFAMRFGDKVVWPKVLGKKDAQSLLCRDLFTYALVLCEAQNVLYEAEKILERVPVLLKRAQQMQNLSEESATYGNFWWTWGSGYVADEVALAHRMAPVGLVPDD